MLHIMTLGPVEPRLRLMINFLSMSLGAPDAGLSAHLFTSVVGLFPLRFHSPHRQQQQQQQAGTYLSLAPECSTIVVVPFICHFIRL